MVFLVFSCGSSDPQLQGFEQLKGSWISNNNENTFSETWNLKGDRLIGEGFLVKGKDTVFGEKLMVENINGKLVYIADVPGQHPTLFTCTEHTPGRWKFENPEHDFPQMILYELKGGNLRVVLESYTPKESKDELIFKRSEP